MSYTAEERETVVVWGDADEEIMVSTSQRAQITKLLKNAGFRENIEDRQMEGGRILSISGCLPLGSITIRSKAKGTIRRKSTRQGRPVGTKTCGEVTGITGATGALCGGIARKTEGGGHTSCAKHKGHPLAK